MRTGSGVRARGSRSEEAWRDAEPIRGEIFDARRFRAHARSLADSQATVARSPRVVPLLARLRADQRALEQAYEAILDDVAQGREITPAAEWIIDNYHLVETHTRTVRRDLPGNYFRELPKLGPGFLAGHPRIFAIVWGYVAHTDSLFDPDLLATYIRAYERRTALTMGELWAVAIALRVLLLENVRRMAEQVVESSHERQRAEDLADRVLGTADSPPEPLERALPDAERFRPTRAFAVRFLQRLTGQQAPQAREWLERRLTAQGADPDSVMLAEYQSQSAATVTVRNIFVSLRQISNENWEDWVERVSFIEEELRRSPGYLHVDFATRNRYRSAIEALARASGQREIEVTRHLVQRTLIGADEVQRDPGYWLIDEGRFEFRISLGARPTLRQRRTAALRALGVGGYIAAITTVTVALLGITGLLLWWTTPSPPPVWVLVGLVLLAGLPLSELAAGLTNYVIARKTPTAPLPGLTLRNGIPEDLRTLLVIPSLLSSSEEVTDLLSRLERHHLANVDPHLHLALATDWPDAPQEQMPEDESLLAQARAGIRDLNRKHSAQFLLFHRQRTYHAGEGVWMGHERKRGKLEELNLLLRGNRETALRLHEGSLPGPFRYVLTLDSDTLLPRSGARRLVGKLAHPLNRARLDPETGRVARGYGILQPRVAPSLPTGEISSLIQRAYSGRRGLDPYAFAVSDAYQDLFGEGSFTGKGLYEIDTLLATTSGRMPENRVLSHDLLEGNYARAGLVTDVEVVEEHPQSYAVTASRAHRWVRGDWQLLPWVLWRHDGLSALGIWKLLDNLRRSLVAPATVLATVAVAASLPATALLVWLSVLGVVHYLPHLITLSPSRVLPRGDTTRRSRATTLGHDAFQGVRVGTLNLVLLAHHAWVNTDAVLRTLVRLSVTRRHLLEWRTAASTRSAVANTVGAYARFMAGGWVAPVLLLAVTAVRGPAHLLVAALPAAAWLAAPVLAQRASQPQPLTRTPVTEADRTMIRLIGRRTWQFFLTFVTAEEQHLPPDNFQEHPEPVVAHRTSPTNIGLYLLSVVSARDLGWIGLNEAIERLEATVASMRSLEHHRGHLYNWYDTRTGQALHPRYVSTVDSGNLAGHLLTLAATARQWHEELSGEQKARIRTDGVRDALALLREDLQSPPHPGQNAAEPAAETESGVETGVEKRAENGADPLPTRTRDLLDQFEVALDSPDPSWADLRARATALHTALRVGASEADETLSTWSAGALHTLESLGRDRLDGTGERARLAERTLALARTAESITHDMDFTFLHDRSRSLMSIGYHVDGATIDDNCFDLMASEARLASYVAIAKGDVRSRHWRLLGRSVTAVGNEAALQSWSGSMFEYLMPPLVMRPPLGSLLERTEDLSVRKQISYTRRLGIPWGISESAFNARDVEYTYQYSPFGVPGLGIMRGLEDNMVIAPYATGLALMVDPGAAVANYRHLERLGARGPYGFYEALDFTPDRVPPDHQYAIVRCFMAHHQGMTVVSAANALLEGIMRDRFHSVPMIRAAELLLQERAPREVPRTLDVRRKQAPITRRVIRDLTTPHEQVFTGRATLAPGIAHWSNGRLSLTLTPAGGGQLRWRGRAITRWHPDPTSDGPGDHLYLHDEKRGHSWSATPMPLPGSSLNAEVRFSDHHASFQRRSGRFETEVEYRVSPEQDAMVRRLTIRNLQRQASRLTITSYAELVLAAARDDDAHPAFSKMFVETEFLPDRDAVVAHRRRRDPDDLEVWAAHVLVTDAATVGQLGVETDRAAFLGRGGTVRRPRQVLTRATPTGRTGHTLDPIFSLSRRIRLPASGEVHLQFWTLVAESRAELLELIDAHHGVAAFQRVTQMSWIQSQVELRHLGINAADVATFRTLAGHVSFPTRALRPPAEEVSASAGPQSLLWPLSISGDLPIVVMRVASLDDLAPVRELVQAFEYWRSRRFSADVVLLNEEGTSYRQELHAALEGIAAGIRPRTSSPDSIGQIRVVYADQTDPPVLRNLMANASVVLSASRGSLSAQLPSAPPVHFAGRALPQQTPGRPPAALPRPRAELSGLLLPNGYGGFSPDGREYVVLLDDETHTPAPWSNVVANAQFGFLATAEGAGSTWWRNSRDNQITPWRNDPVSAAVSEAVYVRDETSGKVLTPTAAPAGRGRHLARHGFGYTTYEHENQHLRLGLTHFVAGEDAAKESVLTITNLTTETREVTVTSYHELVLGQLQHVSGPHLVSSVEPETGALAFRNPFSTTYADQVVLVDLAGTQTSWTADRHEFLGTQGTSENPASVGSSAALSGATGPGLDPCAALRRTVTLPPDGEIRLRVLLVAGHDTDEAVALLQRRRAADPATTLAEVARVWEQRLGSIQVQTPDPSFDVMMNGWLLYQSLACRMLARVGFYQASGAYGFRDQLQDGMAIVLVDPVLARAHLLRAAGRQFLEGDVQHWWLPADGSGVRTRITDDVVWLSHATARYVSVTGDHSVLDEPVPFLEGAVLEAEEHERFFTPTESTTTATLWEHCRLGLEHAFRYGRHGLPLIGTGDWNDGMNRVGQEGRGESVWLGWFLHTTLTHVVGLAEQREDTLFADRCRAEQRRLLRSLERSGWDGAWYRRGYFDDGTPLGSATRSECRIDAIAQSWAVLSGAADPARATAAMDAVDSLLVMHEAKVARLFTPPFEVSEPDPGYIRSYPPGIRENGGQYTHGSSWSIFAHAALGRQDRAEALFSLMNPVNHATTRAEADLYRVEPYVVAADVYSVEPHVGRGGWTWYTGSSGWLFRAGLEAILGIVKQGDALLVHPCLPPHWDTARVRYQHHRTEYLIEFRTAGTDPGSGDRSGSRPLRDVTGVSLDGSPLADPRTIPLLDDGGTHEVVVTLQWRDPSVLEAAESRP